MKRSLRQCLIIFLKTTYVQSRPFKILILALFAHDATQPLTSSIPFVPVTVGSSIGSTLVAR